MVLVSLHEHRLFGKKKPTPPSQSLWVTSRPAVRVKRALVLGIRHMGSSAGVIGAVDGERPPHNDVSGFLESQQSACARGILCGSRMMSQTLSSVWFVVTVGSGPARQDREETRNSAFAQPRNSSEKDPDPHLRRVAGHSLPI